MFLKNCWYVAGWSDNYKNELKAQKILGEDIVFYRQRNGQAVAYRRYSKEYIPDEDFAKENKLGLWQGKFLKPEKWRKLN